MEDPIAKKDAALFARTVISMSNVSTAIRVLALFCLLPAPPPGPAFGDEGSKIPPEPFGLVENQDLAFCQSAQAPADDRCICSAASIDNTVTLDEFADYVRLYIDDHSTKRAVQTKLGKWARYCEAQPVESLRFLAGWRRNVTVSSSMTRSLTPGTPSAKELFVAIVG
jgi:hypothetical protein